MSQQHSQHWLSNHATQAKAFLLKHLSIGRVIPAGWEAAL
jgi:hypothetical protein